MTTVKGIEQGRADYAYKCVKEGVLLTKKVDKAYKAYTRKIPMLMKTNGLGGTFAFIVSKRKNDTEKKDYAYWLLYEQVDKWLRADSHGLYSNIFSFIPKVNDRGEKIELVEALIQLNSNEYRTVTNEVIALFSWLKRFAEGLIEGDDI